MLAPGNRFLFHSFKLTTINSKPEKQGTTGGPTEVHGIYKDPQPAHVAHNAQGTQALENPGKLEDSDNSHLGCSTCPKRSNPKH